MFSILQVHARQVGSLSQSSPPSRHLAFLKALLMTGERYLQTALLISHVRRIHIIENRQHHLLQALFAFHDLHQLIETPSRSSVVSREHYNSNPGRLDRLLKLAPDSFPSLDISVISKIVNPTPVQSSKEVVGKAKAGIFAIETHKDFVTPSLIG